jgi:uncharacterized membrane protein YbaN (DUF454 family)
LHEKGLSMNKIKKALWFTAGLIFLGIAYIGVIVPGIPWSTPSLIATYCFARSSKKFHDYMMNHKLFGPFIANWNDSRVFPTKGKWFMFLSMDASLVIMWFATNNWKAVAGMSIFFALCILWASRFPGSREEAERRKAAGEKLGWFK